MARNFIGQLQRMWTISKVPQRRRSVPSIWDCSELLEDRRPLSGMAGGAAEIASAELNGAQAVDKYSNLKAASKLGRKAAVQFPDMTGHWRIVTELEGVNLEGSLDLTQKGRKVKGTLTNDGQFAGKLTGKFQKTKADDAGVLTGKAMNPAFRSNGFVSFIWDITVLEIISTLSGVWRPGGDDVPVHGTRLNDPED